MCPKCNEKKKNRTVCRDTKATLREPFSFLLFNSIRYTSERNARHKYNGSVKFVVNIKAWNRHSINVRATYNERAI